MQQYQQEVANLTPQERERKVWQIETETRQAWGEIRDIERKEAENTESKIYYINAIAANFERLHYLGVYKDPINTICAHICKLARDPKHPLRASDAWIHMVCDSRYKQGEFSPNQFRPPQADTARVWNPATDGSLLNATSKMAEDMVNAAESATPAAPTAPATPESEEAAKPIETWSYEANEGYQQPTHHYVPEIIPESILKQHEEGPQKAIDEMNPDEYREYVEKQLKDAKDKREQSREAQRRADYLLERADKMSIAIDPEVRGKIKMPTISAKSKVSGPSMYSEALKFLSEIIYRAHEKAEKYKPPPEIDKQLYEWIMTEAEFWAPYVDEKWRKDYLQWFKIMIDEAAFGKHASASSNPTLLDTGVETEVTREQVGDRKERDYRMALKVLHDMPKWKAAHAWYINTMEKAIAERKDDLHDTLSQSA